MSTSVLRPESYIEQTGAHTKSYRLWHPFTQMQVFLNRQRIVVERGEGPFLYDDRGKQYLNMTSCLWNAPLGLGRADIVDAISAQLHQLGYSTLFRATHTAAIRLAEEVAAVCPGDLNRVFLTSNGSESIETAIKMVRQYWRRQGSRKFKVVSLERAYHGVSYGALSASGFADDKDGFGPLLDGFLQIPAPYEYRRAPGLDADEFQLAAARELESAILRENPAEVALFLAEPVLGFGGVIPPSKLYWQTVADVCKRYDVKLVLDEVTTGYGRTGTLFASEAYGIEPDVMALGKAMSAGYFPLGAVVASDEIYEAFLADDHGVRFNHGSTNGGHPGACAAGLKTLEIFASERTVELVSPRGEFLGRQLRGLLELPIVGDVRGAGLMFAIELVADKESKQPLHPAAMTKIVEACFNRGLWVHQGGNNIIMLPPFIMDESLLHEACQRFSKVLRSAMNWI